MNFNTEKKLWASDSSKEHTKWKFINFILFFYFTFYVSVSSFSSFFPSRRTFFSYFSQPANRTWLVHSFCSFIRRTSFDTRAMTCLIPSNIDFRASSFSFSYIWTGPNETKRKFSLHEEEFSSICSTKDKNFTWSFDILTFIVVIKVRKRKKHVQQQQLWITQIFLVSNLFWNNKYQHVGEDCEFHEYSRDPLVNSRYSQFAFVFECIFD